MPILAVLIPDPSAVAHVVNPLWRTWGGLACLVLVLLSIRWSERHPAGHRRANER